MTLDRDAARALFDGAEPMPATAGGAPFAASTPFAPVGNDALTARMNGRPVRRGPDWRLIAPVGVAALCAGAVLLVVSQRDDAEPGKTVASTEITRPLPGPMPMPAPAPVETAAVTPPSPTIEPSSARTAPVVRTQARSQPARRALAPRTVAVAPSVSDASADVSAREPYVPPPALGAPAQVTITPAAPPPVTAPEPQSTTPQQP